MVAVAKTLIIVNCCTIQHTLSSVRVKITVCIRWIRYGQLFWWTNWEKSNETAATTHFLTIQVAEMDEYEKYKPFITASIQYSTISLVSVIRRAVVVVVIIIITNIRSDGSSWEGWSLLPPGRSLDILCVLFSNCMHTRSVSISMAMACEIQQLWITFALQISYICCTIWFCLSCLAFFSCVALNR